MSAKFPYVASRDAKYDEFVVKVQNQLNYLRRRFHGNWPELKADGYFGRNTAEAVKGFQLWHTGSGNGVLDAKTHEQMITAIRRGPSILTKAPIDKEVKKNDPSILDILGTINDSIGNLGDLVDAEIEYAKRLGKFDPKAIASRFDLHISKFDSRIQNIQQVIKKNFQSKSTIDSLSKSAKVQPYAMSSSLGEMSQKQMHKMISSNQTTMNITAKQGRRMSEDFIKSVKKYKYPLLDKVVAKFKQFGITGDLKPSDLKKIKAGAGVATLAWSLKDILCVLFDYEEWGEEKWKQDLVDKCYEFLDNALIGFISTILAKLVVVGAGAAAVAITGTTISFGWMIALVLLLALVIGWFIGKIIEDVFGEGVSITKFFYEGAMYHVISAFYSL